MCTIPSGMWTEEASEKSSHAWDEIDNAAARRRNNSDDHHANVVFRSQSSRQASVQWTYLYN